MRAILLGPQWGRNSVYKRLQAQVSVTSQDLLVGVDGGTWHWERWGFRPHFAVGDWDSLGAKKAKSVLAEIPHVDLSTHKERSDLFFAVLASIYAGANEVLCLGVTGHRPDHHLAMLKDLSLFSTGKYGKLKYVAAMGPEAEYVFLSEEIPCWTYTPARIGQLVSIFALTDTVTDLQLKGFQYSTALARFHPSSLGLSNQATQRKCEVSLRKGQLLVIIPRDGSY